jgi:hypothetical protein
MNKKNINIEAIKKFADEQQDKFNEGNDKDLISFEFEGIDIINPFMNENATEEVDPIEYYGDNFLNSEFANIH